MDSIISPLTRTRNAKYRFNAQTSYQVSFGRRFAPIFFSFRLGSNYRVSVMRTAPDMRHTLLMQIPAALAKYLNDEKM